MPRLPLRRVTVPAAAAAAVSGSLAGLLVFAVCAALWRMGLAGDAATAAQTALLMTLLGMALVSLYPRPTARMTRIRVPISRALPQTWWAREPDVTPLIIACAGAPVVAGAAAALIVFR